MNGIRIDSRHRISKTFKPNIYCAEEHRAWPRRLHSPPSPLCQKRNTNGAFVRMISQWVVEYRQLILLASDRCFFVHQFFCYFYYDSMILFFVLVCHSAVSAPAPFSHNCFSILLFLPRPLLTFAHIHHLIVVENRRYQLSDAAACSCSIVRKHYFFLNFWMQRTSGGSENMKMHKLLLYIIGSSKCWDEPGRLPKKKKEGKTKTTLLKRDIARLADEKYLQNTMSEMKDEILLRNACRVGLRFNQQ